MQFVVALVGALIGAGAAIVAQALAHRFARRREDDQRLETATAECLGHLQVVLSVLIRLYRDPTKLEEDRLTAISGAFYASQVKVNWGLQRAGLPASLLTEINNGYNALSKLKPSTVELEQDQKHVTIDEYKTEQAAVWSLAEALRDAVGQVTRRPVVDADQQSLASAFAATLSFGAAIGLAVVGVTAAAALILTVAGALFIVASLLRVRWE